MLVMRTVVKLVLLIAALILLNFAVVFYMGAFLDSTPPTKVVERLEKQAQLIHHLKRNISRLRDELKEKESNLPRRNRQRAEPATRSDIPWIYVITPTYARWTQKADLTRLAQTLMHVPNLHWILVEDSDEKTDLVIDFLRRKRYVLNTTHLNIRTEEVRRLKDGEPVWRKNRGVEQRNMALDWLRTQAAANSLEGGKMGVVYFGDDDNTYDIELFEEMRYTKKVSVWLVGISGGLRFEGPTCHEGRVTGWYTMWGFERMFQLDMAGFAINLRLILDIPEARIDPNAKRGHLETSILEQLVSVDQLEPRGDNCTKVLVWHTRTQVPNMKHEDKLIKERKPSNPEIET